VKISALVGAGEESQAAMAAQTMMGQCPGFQEEHIDWLPFLNPEWNAKLKDGLRQALRGGVVEKS
jgi:hypothetical protein